MSEPELYFGSEPDNNGDYSWCVPCKGWLHIDYWETNFDNGGLPYFTHRGHNMDVAE